MERIKKVRLIKEIIIDLSGTNARNTELVYPVGTIMRYDSDLKQWFNKKISKDTWIDLDKSDYELLESKCG